MKLLLSWMSLLVGTLNGQTLLPADCRLDANALESVDPSITRACLSSGRCYFTFVPPCAIDGGEVPLVVDLHGRNSCPAQHAARSGWYEQGVLHCAAVVWPTGNIDPAVVQEHCWTSPGGWLAENGPQTLDCCCRNDEGELLSSGETNDFAFLRDVMDKVMDENPVVDPKRVYMTGQQDGCSLAMSMGALHSDSVAAVACQEGSVVTPVLDDYTATPVWHLHGTMDTIIPFESKLSEDGVAFEYLGAMESNDYWGQVNDCKTFSHDDLMVSMGVHGTIFRYSDCRNGAIVELVSIVGDGENSFNYPYSVDLSRANNTVDSTSVAWDFLSRYSVDGPRDPPFPEILGTASLEKESDPINQDPTPTPSPEFRTNCDFGPNALDSVVNGVDIPRTCIDTLTGTRCYYTYVPDCTSGRSPLVLDVHGFNNCPLRMARSSGWLQQATKNCFVLVWPTGNIDPEITQNSCWSAPAGLQSGPQGQPTVSCCCSVQPDVTQDTAFMRLVITDVVRELPSRTSYNVAIDTKRIYLGGHSNGCMLNMAMAAQESDLIAAVCCHAGSVLTAVADDYIPTPVWRIHGNIDVTVPYDGSFSEARNVQVFTGAVEGNDYWGQVNGCKESSVEDFRKRLNFGNIRRYTNCTDGADVELVTITGAGHNPYLRMLDFPLQTTFDTTEWAWEFCSSYASLEEPFIEGVTPSPSAIPVPTATPTSDTPRFCFSGISRVRVNDGREIVLMKDLRIGDQVLAKNGKYERIYAFGHYHHDLPADFLRIMTDQKHPLEVSSDHMVFIDNGQALPASALKTGDRVTLGDGTTSTIRSIQQARRQGVYAPLTESGTLVVNGVVASNYIAYRQIPHWLAHASQAPYRLMCRTIPRLCENGSYDVSTGISNWLLPQLQFGEWCFRQHSVLRGLFVVLLVPLFMIFAFVETIILYPGGAGLVLFLLSWRAARRPTGR